MNRLGSALLTVLCVTCGILVTILFAQQSSFHEERRAWQEAARPLAEKRGLVLVKTPQDLERVLCPKCAITHYEAPNMYVYGGHPH